MPACMCAAAAAAPAFAGGMLYLLCKSLRSDAPCVSRNHHRPYGWTPMATRCKGSACTLHSTWEQSNLTLPRLQVGTVCSTYLW